MSTSSNPPTDLQFIGRGIIPGRSWWRSESDELPCLAPLPSGSESGLLPLGHPGAYEAGSDLIDAVNTALLLRKPLIITGRPGTGKTELAERVAYEFDLGAVLRFEAQSLSEANDLFYRFDYIAQLVASKLVESGQAKPEDAGVMNFVQWGPLGHAILRSAPMQRHALEAAPPTRPPRYLKLRPMSAEMAAQASAAPPELAAPRRSVVLIDEIDKASRDFPNDLLNGIDRMEFRLRECNSRVVRGAGRDSPFHPIVIVTSNSERDLPHPFMRRCVFVHIQDPDRDQLAAIVRKRVFGNLDAAPAGQDGLPALYARLLDVFLNLRDTGELRYPIGTSELLDFTTAVLRRGLDGKEAVVSTVEPLINSAGALIKHADDRAYITSQLQSLAVPMTVPK
ncbi:AAA family ATPase [Massilia sp. S19_KUP03_FR1]|uniref:AAA family ATPase n=1 Tax=Massilia sp. S19_KUP03_FR1 TaxID=3025503 RepID=UPI002FCDDD58